MANAKTYITIPKENLAAADLSNANLKGALLYNADLSGKNLSHANLEGVCLMAADLSGADLSHANLLEADLQDADLSNADLTGVLNLGEAYIDGAVFKSPAGETYIVGEGKVE